MVNPLDNLDQHQHPSTVKLLVRMWGCISQRRRVQLLLLLLVMLGSGSAELLSLGAVVPFLAVLSDPERLWHASLVQELSPRLGLTSANDLLLPTTLAFVVATVIAALIRILNLWLNGRLAAAIGSDLSIESYERTLYQPYVVHVKRNSASVITNTTTQINITVNGLRFALQLITAVVVSAGLITGLLLIDATVAVSAIALFGSAYGLLSLTIRQNLLRNGHQISEANIQQLKALQEGLGAIRDVLLDGSQETYLQIYRNADSPLRQLQAQSLFLGAFPRYMFEALGMVAIALLGGILVFERGIEGAVIPLLGTLALGAQRLLPSLQQIYNGWANLKNSNSAMESVLAMLNQPLPQKVIVPEPLVLSEGIRLHGVNFSYGQDLPEVLQGLDLEIRRGERIGLVGETGSGKSTMVDLLMGLLAPTVGRVLVDGVDLYDRLHPERLLAWRAAIAHVPQSIYLIDSSIAENIAFGVPSEKIDYELLRNVTNQAQISSFIESCPEGYQSFVGERGIRLSGGQRQRIGIARALYKQSSILVLDEATSALDMETEEQVMAAVESLSTDLTVIMIAHRTSTVRRCDRVIRIAKGSVLADGPPQLLLP